MGSPHRIIPAATESVPTSPCAPPPPPELVCHWCLHHLGGRSILPLKTYREFRNHYELFPGLAGEQRVQYPPPPL